MSGLQKGTFVDKNGMKRCASCLEVKFEGEFHNVKKRRDGKDPHCKGCKKKQREERLARDPDYERRYNQSYDCNPVGDDGLTYQQRYYLENRDRIRLRAKNYYSKKGAQLRKKYKHSKRAHNSAREAARANRVPSWLTREHMKQMVSVFRLRDELSAGKEGYHVDHIAPLMGANICGLHVPWNLRVIPASENISKGFIYDEPDGWSREVQLQMRRERWDLFGKGCF